LCVHIGNGKYDTGNKLMHLSFSMATDVDSGMQVLADFLLEKDFSMEESMVGEIFLQIFYNIAASLVAERMRVRGFTSIIEETSGRELAGDHLAATVSQLVHAFEKSDDRATKRLI